MKKFSLLLTMAALMVSSSVFAGSIDYLSNQSAKYLMTFHRTASTDASADIANYNPAGTAFLAQGFYIDVSNQTLFKNYKTDTSGSTAGLAALGFKDEYSQSEPTILLPNVYAVYNFGQIGAGKLAVYGQLGVSAGGGTLKWDDGTAATFGVLLGIFGVADSGNPSAPTATIKLTKNYFEASSAYYTFNAGVSYAFLDDMVSLSVGGKAVMAKRSLIVEGAGIGLDAKFKPVGTASIKGEYEYDATGYTAVFGLDVKPVKELTLAARYEMETDLEFEYDQKELSGTSTSGLVVVSATGVLANAGISDGKKVNNNLPQILSLGAEYKVLPELAVMVDGNIYFLSKADMNGTEDYFGTGWEAGFGAKYQVMPVLTVGVGYMYTVQSAKEKYFNSQATFLNCAGNPPLDSHTFGLGATYTVIENLDLTLAGAWTHYLPESYSFGSTAAIGGIEMAGEYKKDVYNIGIGVGYKI